VRDNNDVLIRSLLKSFLRPNFPEGEDPYPRPIDLEDFMRKGHVPISPDVIERTSIGKIDREFAQLLLPLTTKQLLTKGQLSVLLRFVAFARFRTPSWRRQYFPELYDRQLLVFKDKIEIISRLAKQNLAEGLGASFDGVPKAVEEHFYHVAMMEFSSERFDPLSAMVEPKVKVLHTAQYIPFVTCDNPSRPYDPKRPDKIFDGFLPGFRDRRVQILYPVSPQTCITVSSSPFWQAFSHQTASPNSVRAINTALAIMADKEIIFPGPDISFSKKGSVSIN
jgi:hypothetical protein